MCLVATWRNWGSNNLNYAAKWIVNLSILSLLFVSAPYSLYIMLILCVSLSHCSNPIASCSKRGQHHQRDATLMLSLLVCTDLTLAYRYFRVGPNIWGELILRGSNMPDSPVSLQLQVNNMSWLSIVQQTLYSEHRQDKTFWQTALLGHVHAL